MTCRDSCVAAALVLTFALGACGRSDRPEPPPTRGPARLVEGPSLRETAQCHADLTAMGVAFQPLPDRQIAPGCGLVGTVKLLDIGVPTANLGAVRCGQARAYAAWARNAVAPAAYQILGSELARIDSMGSYACRNVVGSAAAAGRRSGHAIANAIDIGAFVLKDGRRIAILDDWNSADPQVQRFLVTIHDSACRRFGTVLSPAYNAAHRNHLHLEDDHAHLCR
ncbi:extensin family protein [Sphingomonas sp. A2-49]|uniref:extensin family protein n=1 Tax=Sphingomonas sp. A2-49 TaxID=1391375 RepID=UPI0021D27C8D|nr:extensin family protein [Sphingomonas sp. A2-49]MCU6455709.1 extensin family protein [Sphingomonas sp. A2-49]